MHRIYLSPPHMGEDERKLLLDAFDSNWIAPLGPHVDAFERELCDAVGVAHGAALSSGTAALHLALVLLGVARGDEVVVPSLTFSATANAVRYVGAKPIFVDSAAATWTMDPELVAELLEERARGGRRPKAVITVDLYGQCADYDRMLEVCRTFEVPVIVDAAEALGSTYHGRAAGTFGAVGVYSFNGNKIITTSGGGMLVSESEAVIRQARKLATQAREPAPHYQHSLVGYNYRMSNLLAAVGRGQLRVLPARVAARRANYEYYLRALGDLPGWRFMPEASGVRSNRWLTCAVIDPEIFGADREAVRLHLAAGDIEARPVWKPMHLQPVFSECEMRGGRVSEQLFGRGICLPSGSSLTDDDRERIVAAITGVPDAAPGRVNA